MDGEDSTNLIKIAIKCQFFPATGESKKKKGTTFNYLSLNTEKEVNAEFLTFFEEHFRSQLAEKLNVETSMITPMLWTNPNTGNTSKWMSLYAAKTDIPITDEEDTKKKKTQYTLEQLVKKKRTRNALLFIVPMVEKIKDSEKYKLELQCHQIYLLKGEEEEEVEIQAESDPSLFLQ